MLYGNLKGTIVFKGKRVHHRIDELHARPKVGKDQVEMQERLGDGHKAYKEIVKQMGNPTEEAIAAGNRSTVGKGFQLFCHIVYEGRTKKRIHADKVASLITFAEEKPKRTRIVTIRQRVNLVLFQQV